MKFLFSAIIVVSLVLGVVLAILIWDKFKISKQRTTLLNLTYLTVSSLFIIAGSFFLN